MATNLPNACDRCGRTSHTVLPSLWHIWMYRISTPLDLTDKYSRSVRLNLCRACRGALRACPGSRSVEVNGITVVAWDDGR